MEKILQVFLIQIRKMVLMCLEKKSMTKQISLFKKELVNGRRVMKKFIQKYKSIWAKFSEEEQNSSVTESHHRDVMEKLDEISDSWESKGDRKVSQQARCMTQLQLLRSSAMC